MKNNQNNQVIIIRFHYEESDPRYAWRFQYFKEKVLPAILTQTVDNFDIAIRCNQWQEEKLQELSPRIKTFQIRDEQTNYKIEGGKKYFYDFTPWESVIGLEKYEIQYGLDSDDIISPDYIEMLQKTIEENKDAGTSTTVHVSVQPEIICSKTGKIESIRQIYSEKMGSAFMAIYQPTDIENYHFIYEVSHLKLGELFNKSIIIPTPGKCYASVHLYNESTNKANP